MRRLFLAGMLVVLIGMQTRQPNLLILLCFGVLLLNEKGKRRSYILLYVILILLRLNIQLPNRSFTEGYITEINASSFLVENGLDHVLVYAQNVADYHPFDRIVILGEIAPIEGRIGDFGFDALRWASSNRILGSVAVDQTLRFCRESIGHFILSGGFAKKNQAFVNAFRNLIYDTQADDPVMDFVSLGLQFTLVLAILSRLSQRIPQETSARIFEFSGLFLFSWLFGFPLTALRFLLFFSTARLFKDRKLVFSVNILILFLFNPFTLCQWTVLIPLTFQFAHIFYSDRKTFLVRYGLLASIFMRSNGLFLPISLLFFPLVRKALMLISVFFWLATILPFLATLAVLLYGAFANLMNLFLLDAIRVVGTIDDVILVIVCVVFIRLARNKVVHIALPAVLIISPLFVYLNPFPQVVFLNAGQGDAILFRSSFAQCTIVMDTGPPREAKNVIASLRSKSVDKIDTLILTHADADHSGNTELFLKSFTVKRIIETRQDVNCKQLKLLNLDPLKVFGETNSDSLVYATSLNRTRFLMMADAGVNTEAQLLQRFDLTTDIVKIGHHGSQTATSEIFIGKIKAKLAIISVGKNNFGHPHTSVLERLRAFRLNYLTTRAQGDITFTLLPGFALVTDSKYNIRILPTNP